MCVLKDERAKDVYIYEASINALQYIFIHLVNRMNMNTFSIAIYVHTYAFVRV